MKECLLAWSIPLYVAGCVSPAYVSVNSLARGCITGPVSLASLLIVVALGVLARREWRASLHAANHDELTGLANRRAFELAAVYAAARAARGHPVAVLLIDVDHFKLVNDTLGHHVGDEALCRIAHRAQSAARATDILARLGGDEFAILLDGTDLAGAQRMAHVVGAIVEDLPLPGGRAARVSVSVGSAAVRPGESVADALKRADDALYAVKRRRSQRPPIEMPAPAPARA